MANNPLFTPNISPTGTTKPTKAVNQTSATVKRTHNTFDNSFFNFKTQRFGQLEPFWWKDCVAGDNEPYSNSHNVRSLPFASPILSPMKLNKDYFQVPHYAIQPNTWDYIFKTPTQGDDVPFAAQNLFPLLSSFFVNDEVGFFDLANFINIHFQDLANSFSFESDQLCYQVYRWLILEHFVSSGSLLYQLGYKINPVFQYNVNGDYVEYTFDELFDRFFSNVILTAVFRIPNEDAELEYTDISFSTDKSSEADRYVDMFTMLSLLRNMCGDLRTLTCSPSSSSSLDLFSSYVGSEGLPNSSGSFDTVGSVEPPVVDCVRMDVINAYQLACAQYYVNPRVDFLYNAQLYRDNWLSLLRAFVGFRTPDPSNTIPVSTFDYNGIPVLYDYFSYKYYADFWCRILSESYAFAYDVSDIVNTNAALRLGLVVCNYLFGFREQLRFGDYFTDARTQALGYGEPGSDVVNVFDDGISVTDMSQKLVLNRYRTAVAHLDNSSEDYLRTMFGEELPPDYHYPKFIIHSEFGVDGNEVSNTTSDDQGNIVTNLISGDDSAEFNIQVSVPSILIGISYFSIPRVYSQIKERQYMHADRYDMFQPMLQYFGDQEIYNREKSDMLDNPSDSYAYVSRNGEYKQRLSQCSGAFLTSLRSWLFVADPVVGEGRDVIPIYQQNPLAIRAHDFEFNRFLRAQTGLSLGTGFHFIMQYNNKNVDNRPMEVNPLPLYPNNKL